MVSRLQQHEALVLGGGPAGISCALQLHEYKVDYLLIDRGPRLGGQLHSVQNTIRNFAAKFWPNGEALIDDLEELCRCVNLNFVLSEEITSADLVRKTLHGKQNSYESKAIFLATGTRLRTPSIEHLEEYPNHIIYSSEANEETLRGMLNSNTCQLASRAPSVYSRDSNDNSTVYAFDNAFVWPRTPLPPDMDRVIAYDNAVVSTQPKIVDGKPAPLPHITEPQFKNPVLHRKGNAQ